MRPSGIYVPIITPLTNEGAIDLEGLRTLVDKLIGSGVNGIVPLGTSGEFALLNQDERAEVIQTVVHQANGRVPVIAGVSDAGTRNAVENALKAERLGADAVIATPPYYYHVSPQGLFEHFKLIADSVSIPVMVYNIPSYTHTEIPIHTLKRIAQLDRLVGMKYTTTDFQSFLEALYELKSDKFSVMIGSDSMIFQAIQAGGDGAVTGLANIAPKECVQIYSQLKAGNTDTALRIQKEIFPLAQAMGIGDFPAALKEMANMLGLKAGPVRRPLQPLNQEQRQIVRNALLSSGLLKN
ncbi:4-hydroxy-tetrahydrodipicolinate synthase [Candidatus Marsarchaeota G2 archaeon BE_D]|jgi:4-hydroxy-tetrahydrodipicolinate synthase|uniref:4-hydroxy-tetrahydrodipicolinate synthase n=3 Tax=Candidatus Marsarchaeota group 2 TaxID=2203771 RepID=A0A2R6CAA4_9ARCH|nr:MAG: 4-hydroxy-tetrahydrodipicolinate synthase [Candidatus Marsarchaeota G2 archaeon ECH_B_3]PSO02442.1 MAG: 4-hydroxy-tetrahydrodipicolinate synthase [Candidatus Marsarchaeota G2 archaeon ECH_B_1]PSO07778.1 MAG: 4-hydroxy-tetrahydrodipicolinate synthase [Candidatus Marsarchaeota G2 archaeon BE_D]